MCHLTTAVSECQDRTDARHYLGVASDRANILPCRDCGADALRETPACRPKVDRVEFRAAPPFQFDLWNDYLRIRECLRICFFIHQSIDVIAVQVRNQHGGYRASVQPSSRHALHELPRPWPVCRKTTSA